MGRGRVGIGFFISSGPRSRIRVHIGMCDLEAGGPRACQPPSWHSALMPQNPAAALTPKEQGAFAHMAAHGHLSPMHAAQQDLSNAPSPPTPGTEGRGGNSRATPTWASCWPWPLALRCPQVHMRLHLLRHVNSRSTHVPHSIGEHMAPGSCPHSATPMEDPLSLSTFQGSPPLPG